jgi:hypothetical protein
MQDFSHVRPVSACRAAAWRRPKKTLAVMPALEFCFTKANTAFKENAALPDLIRRSGVDDVDRFGLLLSINSDVAFQASQSLFI